MIPKSIKWRLQIWYGLILVLVLAGFGFTAYQLERGRQLGRIDNELQRRFDILARALHAPQRRPNAGGQDFDRPPPGQFPDGALPGDDQRPPRKFQLPPQAVNLFGANDPDNFYFVIYGRDGKNIAQSGDIPESDNVQNDDSTRNDSEAEVKAMKPPPVTMRNGFRELFQILPSGETIKVGCSIVPELRELEITAFKLSGVGGLILLIGLAGGWWFVGRALRPISEISSAAVKISAGDLSQRINIAEAESELGQLAAVLNSTFARLETAFAQQRQFTSDAAHELRTPVAVILTQAQTALHRERTAADYKQTVEACQRAAQRMRKLIESLLALARFDAGQEILKRLQLNFSKTVADCAELVKPLADEREVKIICDLSPLEITGDSERLAQVVTNLLTNAIQYNHAGGEVRLNLTTENSLAILTITDTGTGIAREDLPRVFERFYRADKSRTGAGNAGLGLAISKAIIEAHSGTIEVSSEENAGTIFTIRLPVSA